VEAARVPLPGPLGERLPGVLGDADGGAGRDPAQAEPRRGDRQGLVRARAPGGRARAPDAPEPRGGARRAPGRPRLPPQRQRLHARPDRDLHRLQARSRDRRGAPAPDAVRVLPLLRRLSRPAAPLARAGPQPSTSLPRPITRRRPHGTRRQEPHALEEGAPAEEEGAGEAGRRGARQDADRAVTVRLALSPDELLTTTRSVRKRLDVERPVEREVLEECLAIAQQAPTGGNAQAWGFVVVTDADKRAALADLYRKGWDVYRSRPSWSASRRYDDPDRQQLQRRITSSAKHLADTLQDVPG